MAMLHDIRYGLRTLSHQRLFAAVTVLTLAMGIGATAAIFSLLNAVLFRPLNVPNPDRLVRIFGGRSGVYNLLSYPNYVDLSQNAQSFSALAAYSWPTPISLGSTQPMGKAPSERVWGTVVSGNYFETLGTPPAMGRPFAPDEDRIPDGHAVVIISHHLWEVKFNADPHVVGQAIKVNGQTFDVIGVAPRHMPQPEVLFATDLWFPMMMEPEAMPGQGHKLTSRGETWLSVIGRLKPGASIGQAQGEVATLASRLEERYPVENHQFGLSVLTEREGRSRTLPGLEQVGWIMLGVTGMVLLVACANVAGLLLARSLARRKEFGIRLSLGASRWQLMRQLVTEGLILSLLGGVVGLGVAALGTRLLLRFAPPIPVEISLDTSIDSRVLLFTLVASILTGVLFSVFPAFRSTRLDLTPTLKSGDVRLGAQGSRLTGRDALVIGQVAVSLLLLILAGLFIRSLGKAQEIDLGFNPTNRLLATVETNGYTEQETRVFWTRLIDDARSLPGIIAVSSTAHAQLGPGYLADGHVYIEGETPVPDDRRPKVYYDRVGADYFKTTGTPLLAGRDFAQQDQSGNRAVAVVNQTFARTFWPNQSPLGKHFRLEANARSWIEVIGLVQDGKYQSLGEPPERHLFLMQETGGPTLIIHAANGAAQYAQAVRSIVQNLDPNLSVTDIETMHEHLGFALYPARMLASLLTLFGMLGLALALLGLYGLLTIVVRRRTHEIGIRMAIGAQTSDVVGMVIRQGALLVVIGMALGLVAAYAATHLIAGMLYGISGQDFVTFATVSLSLGLVTLLAMYIPARSAAQVDPLIALRHE
jgi:predicted permease